MRVNEVTAFLEPALEALHIGIFQSCHAFQVLGVDIITERWSCFFDQFAARLRWIRVSHQAAILVGSILLAWTSSGVKMP